MGIVTVSAAYGAAGVRSHRAACEATHVSRTPPEPVMAARMTCLADRKARLRALTDELVTPSANEALPVITKASRLVGELPSVEDRKSVV